MELVRELAVRSSSTGAWYSQFVEANLMGTTALMVYEYFITLDDEVELIWKKPNSSAIKWLFLFIRYFSLTSQLITQVVSHVLFKTLPVARHSCMGVYVWRLVACQTVLTLVELVLIHRVNALYQNRTLMIMLVCYLGAEAFALGFDCGIFCPRLEFGPTCLSNLSVSAVAIYGAIALSFQGIILYLTVRKRLQAKRAGLIRTPLLTLLIRDGAVAFIVIFILQVGAMTYLTIESGVAFMQYWLLSLSSCVGCRLILNLQTLGAREEEERESFATIELTTQLSTTRSAASVF